MKNIFSTLLLVLTVSLFFTQQTQAQQNRTNDNPQKPTVVVYTSYTDAVSNDNQAMVTSELINALTKVNSFVVVDRSADFLQALSKETGYQLSGEVDDAQATKLGKQWGARFILMAKIAVTPSKHLYVQLKQLNVETAIVSASASETITNDIATGVQKLVQKLLNGGIATVAISGLEITSYLRPKPAVAQQPDAATAGRKKEKEKGKTLPQPALPQQSDVESQNFKTSLGGFSSDAEGGCFAKLRFSVKADREVAVGVKNLYVRVLDDNEEVLGNNVSDFTTKFNGTLQYSFKQPFMFDNLNFDFLFDTPCFGANKVIEVYCNGVLIATGVTKNIALN